MNFQALTNATLTLLRTNGESHQKYIRISIAKHPGEFMQILRLGRTRCMCDISVMYLWRLHD